MLEKTRRWIWKGAILALLISWIPLNLWLQRHNDALLDAVIRADLPAMKQAIADGATIHMSIRRHNTLLHVAAMHHDNIAVARFLVQQGVSVGAQNDDQKTALILAERSSHAEIAELLRSDGRTNVVPPTTPPTVR